MATSNPIDFDLMLKQLYEFCEINSGTTNLSGLALMHEKLQKAFYPLADIIETKTLPDLHVIAMNGNQILQTSGKVLYIQKRPHLKRRVLLCGHMDTVYSKKHPFQKLKMMGNDRLSGPGVADMKGGLVVMLHALQAFEQTEFANQLGWDVVINADEETGSLASSAFMTTVAKRCQAALLYEPAMSENGVLAKNRKGNGKITLIATGISAHAGRDFNAGRNAICYLAEIITAVHALNGLQKDVTLNVGLINGGVSLNTVPDKAVAKIDVRIGLPGDKNWVLEKLQKIKQKHQKDGYSLIIDAHFDRPVKRINQPTEKLFSRLRLIGEQQGLRLEWKNSGGCCDGNNLAEHGLAVIDTLGVRGGNIHTSDEYIMLDSLVERASLTKLLLIDLAQGQLEAINLEKTT